MHLAADDADWLVVCRVVRPFVCLKSDKVRVRSCGLVVPENQQATGTTNQHETSRKRKEHEICDFIHFVAIPSVRIKFDALRMT